MPRLANRQSNRQSEGDPKKVCTAYFCGPAFLICSLLGAATVFHESFGLVALGMHVLGLLLFLAGISWAIWELRLSLTPLEEERAYLEIWTAQQAATPQRHQQIKMQTFLEGKVEAAGHAARIGAVAAPGFAKNTQVPITVICKRLHGYG